MQNQQKPLVITSLEVENFKRVKAVRIDPQGNLIVVGGRNAQGKSSLLDSIEAALAGAKALPPVPVREGARRGRIKLQLGSRSSEGVDVELTVERTFKDGKTSLSLTAADDAPIASPQTLLNALCDAISFDPLAFSRMDPPKQDVVLKRAIGLDFSAHDAERDSAYAKRKDANARTKSLQARLDAMPDKVRVERVSVADLLKEQQRIRTLNNAILEEQQRLGETAQHKLQAEQEIAAGERQLEALRAQIQDAEENLKVARRELERALIEYDQEKARVEKLVPEDEEAVNQQIANAEDINRRADKQAEIATLERELSDAQREADAEDDRIKAIADTKAKLLAEAQFPVPGLGFDDVGPTLDGKPFEQASTAQKIRTSVALGLALNPRLKVLLIREGSNLDSEALRMIAEMAQDAGAEVWIERVSEDGKGCTVVIEDGELVVPASEVA